MGNVLPDLRGGIHAFSPVTLQELIMRAHAMRVPTQYLKEPREILSEIDLKEEGKIESKKNKHDNKSLRRTSQDKGCMTDDIVTQKIKVSSQLLNLLGLIHTLHNPAQS